MLTWVHLAMIILEQCTPSVQYLIDSSVLYSWLWLEWCNEIYFSYLKKIIKAKMILVKLKQMSVNISWEHVLESDKFKANP